MFEKYFTLSNIGLCMEMLNRFDDSRLMFHEQFEISKLIKNSKFKANALLNLVNLYLNKTQIDSTLTLPDLDPKSRLFSIGLSKNADQIELLQMLRQLFAIYEELSDSNGKLFTSQCLAYCYHTNSNLNMAVKFYKYNIKLTKSCGHTNSEMLNKSLFNLSLCYKTLARYEEAYNAQMEYLELIEQLPNNELAKFTSLGLIGELLFEMNKSELNCQSCIQIHIDRLKIIKSADTAAATETKKLVSDEAKCKLISDCLESIAKCYYQMENYQQVLKFKLLQVELQNELATNENKHISSVNKLKIWLDIGNLFLFKFEDATEAFKYFESVLEVAQAVEDLLLQSLVLGNMGVCKQKMGEYEESLEYFKEQLLVLEKKLNEADEPSLLARSRKSSSKSRKSTSSSSSSSNSSSSSKQEGLTPTADNIGKIKEVISIRIDIGRAYSKLGKCNELLSNHKVQSQFHLNEALKYFNEYCKVCEYLFENYARAYVNSIVTNRDQSIEEAVNSEENADSLSEESDHGSSMANSVMKELCEQIYIDYDASFAKLANFYNLIEARFNGQNNLSEAIEINERRLSLLEYARPLLSRPVWVNYCIQINFILANFYSKNLNTLSRSNVYCENIIQMYAEEPLFEADDQKTISRFIKSHLLKDNTYLVETLNLLCDICLLTAVDTNFDLLVDKAMRAHKMIWQCNRPGSAKTLRLKFDAVCRLCCIYRRLRMPKECLEVLMEGVNRLTHEFQHLQQQIETQESVSSSSASSDGTTEPNSLLIQYIEYLFLLQRKIALIHMRHAMESNLIAKNKDLVEKSFFLALKYVNEALAYLNYQKQFQMGAIIECRQASIYFLLGKCHKFLKNTEMELEMFANSLDLYENIVSQQSYNADTCIKDRMVSSKQTSQVSELFDAIRNDDDEETVVKYMERVDQLYQHIEDALVKMNKLKEALLVTERHRAKKLACLGSFAELLTFDEIEALLAAQQLHAIVYFSRVEVSAKINCWLLMPHKGIVKFHQVTCKMVEKLTPAIKNRPKSINMFCNELQRCGDETEQNMLLRQIYELLMFPFEEALFDELVYVNQQFQTKHLTKPPVFIVYDEDMFKLPFHLLRTSRQQPDTYLFDIFEIDCGYSLKLLFRTVNCSQRFVKHQNAVDSRLNMPMKVISNELDMEKLLSTSAKTNLYQYDLLLLLVDSDNKGCIN